MPEVIFGERENLEPALARFDIKVRQDGVLTSPRIRREHFAEHS
ncbi:MAG: 30S ribosomal protein S21 [Chloroflexota bacterium]|nr:MAG: 30S ribosomal protein S21 [Chloroflexota bacterium]